MNPDQAVSLIQGLDFHLDEILKCDCAKRFYLDRISHKDDKLSKTFRHVVGDEISCDSKIQSFFDRLEYIIDIDDNCFAFFSGMSHLLHDEPLMHVQL